MVSFTYLVLSLLEKVKTFSRGLLRCLLAGPLPVNKTMTKSVNKSRGLCITFSSGGAARVVSLMWSGLLTALTHRVKVISFNHTRHTSHSFPPILFMLICSAHTQLSDKLQVSHSPLSRLSWRTDLLLRVNFSSAEKFGAIQHTYVCTFLSRALCGFNLHSIL